MLTIRREQMNVFRKQRHERFLDRLARHARRFFPEQTKSFDDGTLRQICRSLVLRGSRYGFETERDLCKFLNVAFVFGEEFDQDPDIPWIRPYLDDDTAGPTLKVNRLYLEALKHEDEGRGLRPSVGTAP